MALFKTSNGNIISYTLQGKGQPVLLLHGFGEDHNVFNQLSESIHQNASLIIPDIPGSGASELIDPTQPGIDHLASDFWELVAHLNVITSIVIIGHSMGGYIGLAMAEQKPSAIKALGLFHSTAYADSAEKVEARTKSIAFIQEHGPALFLKQTTPNLFSVGFTQNNASFITGFVKENSNFSSEALVYYYNSMINRPNRTAILKSADYPILMIIGKHDKAVPYIDGLEQSYLAKETHVLILENTAHMGMFEEPQKVTNFVKTFLQNIEIQG